MNDKPEVKVYTLPQAAKMLGIHRTTLKRFEDRGIVPPAKWITSPFRARIYTEKDFLALRKAVSGYLQRYAKPDADGIVVDPDAIVELPDADEE